MCSSVVSSSHLFNSVLKGPVREVLSRSVDGRQKTVLDVGCNSPWMCEMAVEFPDTLFVGVDLVPTPHAVSRKHVKYEIYDFTQGLRYPTASFDLVHARHTFTSVSRFAVVLYC